MATAWTDGGVRSRTALQALTESAPTLATDGVLLDSVDSIALVVHAPATQTFTGTGSLLGYYWNGTVWARTPRADYDLSDIAGLADAALTPLPVVSGRGRFMWVPSAVGVSGAGGNMTTEYLCTTLRSAGLSA